MTSTYREHCIMTDSIEKNLFVKQLATLVALLCVVYFVRHFEIETELGIDKLLLAVVPLFYVSTFLKNQHKPILLTVATHCIVIGFLGFSQGSLVLLLGWLFFGITLLPLSYKWKLTGILIAGLLLLLFRVDWFEFSSGDAFVPVVASLFMFRMILYLHEIKYQSIKEPFWQRASYFFMLPNIFILLFPIVDFKNYANRYFNEESTKIYSKGIGWILLGALQIALYKLVYHHWVFPLTEVENALDAFNFVASNYGLFIRVNGLFNIAMGILCLFGYNLPAPFYWFYFAPNFSEIWRRINTYWRDFVQKVFYYPMMFRFKKLGVKKSIIIAMLYSFLITYILHSYQWFWLRGDFLITTADAAFWGIFGILITLNSVILLNKKRTIKAKSAQQLTVLKALALTIQTLGMFFIMAILIGLWNSPTVKDWFGFLPLFTTGNSATLLQLTYWFLSIITVGTALQFIVRLPLWNRWKTTPVLIQLALFSVLSMGLVQLDKTAVLPQIQPYFTSVKSHQLNLRDEMALTEGYYESVINVNRNLSTRLSEVEEMRPENWEQLAKTTASKDTNNLLVKTLVANANIVFKNQPFTVNQHGFRDRNYPTQKPDSTLRFALLGSSVELGSGVANHEVFETIAEKELQPLTAPIHYQFLNYSISGYGLVQHYQNTQFDSRIYVHQPDVVLLAIHKSDAKFIIRGIIDVLKHNTWQNDSILANYIQLHELTASMNEIEIYKRIEPSLNEIAEELLTRIYKQVKARNCQPMLLFVPESEIRFKEAAKYNLLEMGKQIGFKVLSLDGAYNNMNATDLQVTAFDHHPNAFAHQLLAQRFIEVIQKNDSIFREHLLKEKI